MIKIKKVTQKEVKSWYELIEKAFEMQSSALPTIYFDNGKIVVDPCSTAFGSNLYDLSDDYEQLYSTETLRYYIQGKYDYSKTAVIRMIWEECNDYLKSKQEVN